MTSLASHCPSMIGLGMMELQAWTKTAAQPLGKQTERQAAGRWVGRLLCAKVTPAQHTQCSEQGTAVTE